jgi:hypothetical protein
MKPRTYFILPLIAGAAFLPSCNKSDEAVNGDKVEHAVEVLEEKIKEEVKVEEKVDHLQLLAERAGFAAHLPKQTSAFWTFYNGAEMAKKLRDSKVGVFLNTLAEQDGESLDDLLLDPDFAKFAEITGEELFFAVGEGTPKQAQNLLDASALSNYHQMRSMVEIFGAMLGDDESSKVASLQGGYIEEWLQDPKLLDIFVNSEMPPIYLGFKLSDTEKRQSYLDQVDGGAQMLVDSQTDGEEVVEKIDGEGSKGIAVRGELLVKVLEGEEGDEMREALGEDAFNEFKESASEKDLVALVAEKGDYLVFFMGSAEEQFQFAASPAESVLAHEEMKFAQEFSEKELISLLFMEKELAEVFIKGQSGVADMARGVLDGLKETDVFGDTRVLEGLLGDLIEREKAYYAPYHGGLTNVVTFYEEGIKMESLYTGNSPEIDLKSKRQLAEVGAGDDVLFFANWVNNPAQVELAMEYIDSLGSTAYQMTQQASGLEFESSDFTQFTASFSMVDGMLKNDLMQLWSALRDDLSAGLGAESAVVVDINGELPTVPMIPEEVVKEGKLPRFSYLSTVKDRSQLSASWEKINSTAERLLKQASMLTGTQIPMQRPFKSESNGLTSWSFQIPFAHQNCTPSVSVSDDLFVMGTSSDFANQLAGKFSKEATAEPMSELKVNFAPLRVLSSNWLELVEKHGAAFMEEVQFAQFKEAAPVLKGLIEASEAAESIIIQTKETEQGIRSSFHFKVSQ